MEFELFFLVVWTAAEVPTSPGLLSRECVAAGVNGGDCMRDAAGVMRGELLPDAVLS